MGEVLAGLCLRCACPRTVVCEALLIEVHVGPVAGIARLCTGVCIRACACFVRLACKALFTKCCLRPAVWGLWSGGAAGARGLRAHRQEGGPARELSKQRRVQCHKWTVLPLLLIPGGGPTRRCAGAHDAAPPPNACYCICQ